MADPTVLGRRLKQAREEAGLNQLEFAMIAKLHLSTVTRLEQGRGKSVNTATLEAMADVLNVSTDWLLGRTDERRVQRPDPPMSDRATPLPVLAW